MTFRSTLKPPRYHHVCAVLAPVPCHTPRRYHVIKMFTPYGKIRREEYLWHTYGPKRGEPRGYAFVEYSKREEAELARSKMNGRTVFGRPLVVRFVDEKVVTYNTDAPVWNRHTGTTTTAATPTSAVPGAAGAVGAAGVGRGGGAGAAVATASAADGAKRARVAAIQSKLRAMEQEDRQRKQGQAPKTMNMIRPPPSGFGGGFPPGAGRGDGGERGGDRGGGEGRGAGGGYSRTLLQSGTRWSAWG
ncbi:unnamed protein product [Closterium sp. Naga37s-1]|nr:unnamed protein product [Closterium sp. Naga37s-1]